MACRQKKQCDGLVHTLQWYSYFSTVFTFTATKFYLYNWDFMSQTKCIIVNCKEKNTCAWC